MVVKVISMKKVTLVVEFVDANNDICFGVLFFGVMTRRNVYLKPISVTDSSNYVQIKKKDVKKEENIKSVYDGIVGITHWSISVPEELGLDDPRILPINGDNDIIAEVDKFVAECDNIHKRISP